jgi:hypothetical protein
MGISADYNDTSFATRCNFRPPNWVSEPLSMLPTPQDRIAAQECVGGDTKGPDPTAAKVRFAVDVEVLGTYHKGTYVMYPYLGSHYDRVLVVIRYI